MELPVLIAQNGPLEGQQWPISGSLTIGRDDSCEVTVSDRSISRHHARISLGEQGAVIEDLDSKNGTYLNDVLVQTRQNLREGDVLRVAFVQTFVFLSSDSTLPLTDLPEEVLELFRLRLDEASRRVWIKALELDPPLSAQQFSLLAALYQKVGEVVPREELIREVWGTETEYVTEQAFDALVRRLRERLNQNDPEYDYIVTVRGHGLRLDNQAH